ncbi:MAG: peptidase C1, partial [Acidobacteria bacterium]|nr:peptidase C1 [Acidobacteriota bacterium]
MRAKRIRMPALIVALMVLSGIPGPAGGDADVLPQRAPLNPAFEAFIQQGTTPVSSEGRPLGYLPPPVSLAHVKGLFLDEAKRLSYPSQFDLRLTGKLTAVRDQGSCGSCWAFATCASLESYLLPGETVDFSEQDLNANHGFDWLECAGGNAIMSQAYLARWSGPMAETDCPYPYSLPVSGDGLSPEKHVQQVVFLPERADATDNDTIKYYLTRYGALCFSFHWSAGNWNSSRHAYFDGVSSSANHAVAVVGWDDDFDKAHFNTTPAGNGAFIARNSWGSSWGDGGYFYISYYDTSLQGFVSFNSAEPIANYAMAYQYDPLGWVWCRGYGD